MKVVDFEDYIMKQDSTHKPRSLSCDYIQTYEGLKKLDVPIVSDQYACEFCSGKQHYVISVNHENKHKLVWLCGNVDCVVYKLKKKLQATNTLPTPLKPQEWPLFCEINGIGDVNHDVKFENIKQSEGMIAFLRKFADNPRDIVLMQGKSGNGKTYAAMATCELFIRSNPSCIFCTQKQMLGEWLKTFNEVNNYIDRITRCNLLVVDDFGTGDVSPGFMGFFLDVINTRNQWKNRGTIITTNLDDKALKNICGEALLDRIRVGQLLEFKEVSRRKKPIC